MTKFFDFKDKVVVITGAGGVICGELARNFAKQGAKVALLDLNEEAAQKFEKLIKQEGGVAKAYKANVLEQESLEQVRHLVNTELGTVDILINGASKGIGKPERLKHTKDKILYSRRIDQ